LINNTPRTVPKQTDFFNPRDTFQQQSSYKKFPMATHNSKQDGGITFAAQDKLPKLPIPELESSLKKYLRALKPLQTPREHSDSRQAVEDFLRTDGPELQEKLRNYAQGKSSYIEQFCKFFPLLTPYGTAPD
jgi:carnitine O-acetyltransferase